MARPVEFTDELQAAAWAYIKEYESHGDAFPSVVGLCSAINRARTTIYQWSERDDNEFKDILEAINEKQQQVILNNSIRNDFNAQISKLVLGKHGYHDSSKTDVTSGGEKIQNNWTINPVTTDKNGSS